MKKIITFWGIFILLCFSGNAKDWVTYRIGEIKISIPSEMVERTDSEEQIMKSVRRLNGVKELKKKLKVDLNAPISRYRFQLKGWFSRAKAGSIRDMETKILVRIDRNAKGHDEIPDILTSKDSLQMSSLWKKIKKSMKSAMGDRLEILKNYYKPIRVNEKTGFMGYMIYSLDKRPNVVTRNYIFVTNKQSVSITMNCLLSEESKWAKIYDEVIQSFIFL